MGIWYNEDAFWSVQTICRRFHCHSGFYKDGTWGTEKVCFYDMKADGFSPEDKRMPVKENDIPDLIHRSRHLGQKTEQKRMEQGFTESGSLFCVAKHMRKRFGEPFLSCHAYEKKVRWTFFEWDLTENEPQLFGAKNHGGKGEIYMATYVIADIHGEYDLFQELLTKMKLKETDTLYILGDVLDRGPHPIQVLLKLMEMPNAIPLVGNHELMALECLEFLCKEITEESISEIDSKMVGNLLSWQGNGGITTTDEFHKLDREMQREVVEYLKEFILYEELVAGGKSYLLVHAGLGNYAPEKEMEEYSLKELIWDRADYETQYFKDVFVVTGHTPTQAIEGNPRPGYIYRENSHIAIDCGACFPGGRLAAICLDTGEEFYSSTNNRK